MDFDLEYDVTEAEQNCAAGAYTGEVADVRIDKTKPDTDNRVFPVVFLDWRMTETESDEDQHQKSIGAVVSDRFALYPQGDRRNIMTKRRWVELSKAVGITLETLIPKHIKSKNDFDDLIGALKGVTAPVWVTRTASKDDPNTIYENVRYTAPRGTPSEPDETPSTSRMRAAPPAKKGAKGKR